MLVWQCWLALHAEQRALRPVRQQQHAPPSAEGRRADYQLWLSALGAQYSGAQFVTRSLSSVQTAIRRTTEYAMQAARNVVQVRRVRSAERIVAVARSASLHAALTASAHQPHAKGLILQTFLCIWRGCYPASWQFCSSGDCFLTATWLVFLPSCGNPSFFYQSLR